MLVRADAPLVERERELEALGRVLDAAREGAGAAVLVEGAAGIGKVSAALGCPVGRPRNSRS
jgi:hypothetical protein